MDNERSAIVNIGGTEYEMILTTRATKEIAGRYGGLENLGQKLMKSENFEMAIDEVVWLIMLLANQSVLIHNLMNPDNKKELLTAEIVELLTSPLELATYKNAILCMIFSVTSIRMLWYRNVTPRMKTVLSVIWWTEPMEDRLYSLQTEGMNPSTIWRMYRKRDVFFSFVLRITPAVSGVDWICRIPIHLTSLFLFL